MSDFINIDRIITFVPDEKAEQFLKQISPDIPHIMGEYDQVCWFSESGTEQSRHIASDDLKRASSTRFEFCIPLDQKIRDVFIQKIRQYHPWEEPVILLGRSKIHKHD